VTRIITNDEIETTLSITDCLSSLETMFTEMGHGRAITDSREDVLTPVPNPPEDTTDPVYHGLKSMGGSIPELEVGAVRINSDVIHWPPKNGSKVRDKVPAAPGERYTGLVLLFSTNTGEPLAIFPDGIVQSYRVGSTSALGGKYLAREDATTLTMLGAGWQARAHLRAHAAVQDLDSVRVYSPTPESRQEYAEEMADVVDATVEAVDDPQAACVEADIVQCATNALSPVFELDWIEPGTHVGVIRSTEAPDELFDPDRFNAFVQSWSHITKFEELGNQLDEHSIPTKNVNNYVVEGDEPVPKFEEFDRDGEPLCDWTAVPGLGDVIASDSVGRSSDDGRTLFYNRGMGIQFAAVGKTLYEIAEREDLGQELPTELFTQEYHP
jgi:ornithine cyclodeaminase/alanine dehydrogenase-like protein (mu-crystallin family)